MTKSSHSIIANSLGKKAEEKIPTDNIYQSLSAEEIPHGYTASDGFYQYGDNDPYDWKIHISVAHDQVAQAHDAIVNILKREFKAYKVIVPDYPTNQRHYHGAQFTLYLSEESESDIEKLKRTLEEINSILKSQNIQQGAVPKSDAPLLGDGFISLRNDGTKSRNYYFNQYEYHFMPEYVGTHYNPENSPNPYFPLLRNPDPSFELKSYLNEFEVNSIYGLYQAIGCTIMAYFYDKYGSSFESRINEIFELPENDNPDAYLKFDKAQYFLLVLASVFSGMPQEDGMDVLKKLPLRQFYPYNDQVGDFLLHIDKIKHDLPTFTENAFSSYTNGAYYNIPGLGSHDILETLKKASELIQNIAQMKEEIQSQKLSPKQ